jgi:hypothetical protein
MNGEEAEKMAELDRRSNIKSEEGIYYMSMCMEKDWTL